jgi:hypothetical protein
VLWTSPISNGAPITAYYLSIAEASGEFRVIYEGINRPDIL